jgi:hypothetical protein
MRIASPFAVSAFPKMELSEPEIASLYLWIDKARYSKTKKNITRDFSDGGWSFFSSQFHVPNSCSFIFQNLSNFTIIHLLILALKRFIIGRRSTVTVTD